MDAVVHDKFTALLQDEQLEDPSWILQLDALDEPPLFTRQEQIEFLRGLPEQKRLVCTLEITLSVIERIAEEAARSATDRIFFVCATFSDFDLWRGGEQLVPTPAILVNPNEDRAKRSDLGMAEPYSADAVAIAKCLTELGPNCAEVFCVGELMNTGDFDPDLTRVYVGWRVNPSSNIMSVGHEISDAPRANYPEDPDRQ